MYIQSSLKLLLTLSPSCLQSLFKNSNQTYTEDTKNTEHLQGLFCPIPL